MCEFVRTFNRHAVRYLLKKSPQTSSNLSSTMLYLSSAVFLLLVSICHAYAGSRTGLANGKGLAAAKQNFVQEAAGKYAKLLDKHPMTTKIVSSGVIGGTGDVLIQLLQGRKTSNFVFDYRRLLVFSTVTSFYIAPVIGYWFDWLAQMPMPERIKKPGKLNEVYRALYMMIFDQTIGATVITIGFFYAFEFVQKLYPPYNAGGTSFLASAYRLTKDSLWRTLVINWYMWPLINFLNFLVIPLQFRVLFSNIAAIFWNMFLSSVANA